MPHALGRYILERTLAHGGMGEVHLARQTGPDGYDRTCVVKTMHANLADDRELVEMFLEEARLTAKLTHAHIAQVYDFGKIDAAYYMAMELVDGPSLHTVIKSHAQRKTFVPLGPSVRMISQAAQALDYVHRLKGPDGVPLNLVHRDISPGNLLLSKEGMVKLVDFGIAKARTTARRTKMGQVRGKLAYMSPEQLLGLPLDGRTDIYSLGLVLYELLACRRAMAGKNEVEILESVRTATLEPIRKLRDDCPQRLADVLDKAVTRDREQRFQRASDFSQALEHVLMELGTSISPDDLTAIAEDVLLPANTPRPSPAVAPRLPSNPNVPTKTGTAVPAPHPSRPPAATVLAPPTSVMDQPQSVTAPVRFSSRARLLLVLGAFTLVSAGVSVGVLARAGAGSGTPPPPVTPQQAAAPQPVPAKAPEPAPPPAQGVAVPAEPLPLPVLQGAGVDPAPAAPAAPPQQHIPTRVRGKLAQLRKLPLARADGAPRPPPLEEPAPSPPPALVAKTGTLNVQSDPPMEIVVDGQVQGVAPRSLTLAPGPHEVTLREPRLKLEHRQSVTLSEGSAVDVSWKPTHGLVDVRAVPPDVELAISIDGEMVGTTPLPEITVWEGARSLVAVNKGTGWRAEQRISVPAGGKLRVKVKDGSGMDVTPR